MSIFSRSRLLAAAMVVATPTARAAAAQASAVADRPAVGSTSVAAQRGSSEVDDQRRRLDSALQQVDSTLRVLAGDSARIAALQRPAVVDQGVAHVAAAMRELRLAPDSVELTKSFIDAVTATTRDFAAGEDSLASRLLPRSAAAEALGRSPHAAVVSIDGELPPRNTAVWEKIRQSNYGRHRMARITFRDVANFRAAVSDTGFQTYRNALLGIFTKRMTELRQARDAKMAEIQSLQPRAAELPHPIAAADNSVGRAQAHAINVGLPVIAVVFVTLLLAPLIYRSPELQQWIFTSGVWLEITTLVLVVIGLIVLGLAGKVNQAVVGTVLGGVLGYVVGRSASRRTEAPMPVAVPAPPAVSDPVATALPVSPHSPHS
jgi:hypothetical protein